MQLIPAMLSPPTARQPRQGPLAARCCCAKAQVGHATASSGGRGRHRRLVHAPFTTQNLHGWWAIGMTTAVWIVAGVGVFAKLRLPGPGCKRFWVGLYLALGWLVLVAIKPMIDGLSWAALLAAGDRRRRLGLHFVGKPSST
ncbi:hypothetical protein ACRAWD_24185 [Caulobacter segnis]